MSTPMSSPWSGTPMSPRRRCCALLFGMAGMTELRALSVGASLLAIKTNVSQRASPAGTKRSPGSNKKQVLLASNLQCALNLASPQTESRP